MSHDNLIAESLSIVKNKAYVLSSEKDAGSPYRLEARPFIVNWESELAVRTVPWGK